MKLASISHPGRPAMTIAAAILLTVGVLSSCAMRRPSPRRISHPPLPRSPQTIRVRLVDPAAQTTLSATGPCRLLADGRELIRSEREIRPTTLSRDAVGWSLDGVRFRASEIRLEPTAKTGLVGCNGRRYRGVLIVRPAITDPTRLTVNNHLPLEHYLPGVLARELLKSWHAETYKALAVAARTYAMYEIGHIGRRRSFDVYADQRSQVYGGVRDETPKSLDAVRKTWGQVLTVGEGDLQRVFKAYYSSTCGGITVDAQGLEHQSDVVRPLAGGVICNDCAFSRRYRWDPVRIAKTDVFAALACTYDNIAAMGPLKAVRVSTATAWGRPQWLDIVPVHGRPLRVRADDLRLALLRHGPKAAKGIYSMNCTIRDAGDAYIFENGKGFGHGVGLCQYGAEGKARRGLRYHEILYIYYPGSKITRAY